MKLHLNLTKAATSNRPYVRPAAAEWIEQIFRAQTARTGGIVRRKLASVRARASLDALEAEVRRRGFHMVISGDQCLIFCHSGEFRMVC